MDSLFRMLCVTMASWFLLGSVLLRGLSRGPRRQQPKRRRRTLKIVHDELLAPDHAHTSHVTWRIGLQGTNVEVPVDVGMLWRSNLKVFPNIVRQLIEIIVQGTTLVVPSSQTFNAIPF